MKRLKLGIILLVLLMLSFTEVLASTISVELDGSKVQFTDSLGYPFIDNNRTLVPLRVTMESFGAKVDWDGKTQTAIVAKNGTTVKVGIGKNYVEVNGNKVANDAAAVIKSGRTYLPIRVVLESLGADVGWNATNKTVVVTSDECTVFINSIEKRTVIENYWPIYEKATTLMNNKSYSEAIVQLESIIPSYIKTNDDVNAAMMYGKLGFCYSEIKEYQKSAWCYYREVDYWQKANQAQMVIAANRKANLIEPEVSLYCETTNEALSEAKYFGAPFEQKNGILLGIYAEHDPGLYDPYDANKFYMDKVPEVVGKDHGAYLIYFTYGDDLDTYKSHITRAKEKGKVIELGLQPLNGLDNVNDTDGYLIKLAKDMEGSGVKFYLRFANEMNDPTSKWYTTDYSFYIQKFRTVAKVFKQYAPSVAVVWAPNFFPPDTIANYYPGDEYVDYVGISSYQNYNTELDPLNQGVDRARWSDQLDYIYSLYGNKKPIIITEGGCSYIDRKTLKDITDYSARQINDFYTYLPIKYPNVKAVFYYGASSPVSNYRLSENSAVLSSYKNSVNNSYYLSNISEAGNINTYYVGVKNNQVISDAKSLCCFVKYPENNITKVEYKINGNTVGTGTGLPYRMNCDLSAYKGNKVSITVNLYTSEKMVLSKAFNAFVK